VTPSPWRILSERDIEKSSELFDAILRLLEDPVAFGHAIGHRGILTAQPGSPPVRRKQFSRLHREITANALSTNRTSTIVSRNHGKTTLLMDIALWEKWRDPEKRTMYVSAATQLANEILGEMRNMCNAENMVEIIPAQGKEPPVLVPFSAAFPQLVPCRASPGSPPGSFNTVGRQGMGREPCFFPSSIGSNKAGKHPTDIYVDDPSNERNSTTPVQREKVIQSFKQLEPILRDPSGNIRHIGTPWAFYDLSAWIGEHSEEWSQYRFGCWDGVNPNTGIADKKGRGPNGAYALCPDFMSDLELLAAEDRIDDPEFWSQQYLVQPVAAAYALFPDKRLRESTLFDILPENLPKGRKIILWDPTSRADAKIGDWNGIILVHVTTAERCIGIPGLEIPGIADMPPDTNIFFPVQAREIRGQIAECMEYVADLIYENSEDIAALWVENTMSCDALRAWAHQQHWARKVRFVPINLKSRAKKQQRLQGIQVGMAENRIFFPGKFPGRDILLKRLSEFPKSESDDLPDAFALLTNFIMKRGAVPGIEAEKVASPGPDSPYWKPPPMRHKRRR